MVRGPSALLGLLLSGCSASESGPERMAPVVRVIEVARGSQATTSYTGEIRARVESDLGFRVSGKIVERLVDPGRTVTRGQPLMRIDATDLRLGSNAARQRVREAQATAERAAADERRLRRLVETGAVSAQAYDNALAQARSTAAAAAAAKAEAGETSNRIGYATLAADADGVVIDVLAQPGQVVAAGTPVVRLGRAGPREAAVSVPEAALAALPRFGEAFTYSSPGVRFPATLREVSGSADPATRTFAARYSLAAAGATAPLGATVTVMLRPPSGGDQVAVPLAALRESSSGPFVWVVRSGKATARRVTVASLGSETASLAAEAFSSGDRVVALGAHLLREGQSVRVSLVKADATR